MKCAIACLLMAVSSIAWSQNADYKSTICNADGTVTFQYKNDNAKEVQVDVQFAGRNKMQKDAKSGLWTVTLGPAAPDMYPYCFVVDGVSVMDPECNQYFPNEGFKNSLLEIPAQTGSLPHDIKNVPHGKIDYIHYYSSSLGGVNNAIVYTPASYDKDTTKKYPVFYLISGTTDTEEVYYKVGRMNYILDNLLAEGKAEEMIVVLPYGNPTKLLPPSASASGFGGMGMMRDIVGEDLTGDLMTYVQTHYRTINDSDHRAIGGFSRGGNQGLGIGLRNLDKFSYLCSYSSFTSTDIPNVYDNAADTNSKINLFWLGVGTDDFLYGNARDYMQHLDDHGIRSVKEYTTDKFGHTWMNAKYFLTQTMQLLFNKEASKAAMANAQPAKAKTGEEQQFTPGVMARLFPRQVTSPEWGESSVTLRINAPEAKNVMLEGEMLSAPAAMTKDADGVWSVTLNSNIDDVYKYCFVVDGTKVADPTNMYLSPDKGFKYSILSSTSSPYDAQNIGNHPFGVVSYDLNNMTATYTPAKTEQGMKVIQVVPGKYDTIESWFKVGAVNLIADKLIADGAKPVIITTANTPGAIIIKADDFPNWKERREAVKKAISASAISASSQVRVACIGNSITYGHGIQDRQHDTYPAQLQKMLGSDFIVENFGVSATTAQKEGDFPWTSTEQYKQAKAFLPQIAVIKLGTNDTKPQNWVGSERFISNLESIASEFASLPSHPRIIIALPAKAYEIRWDIRDSVICAGELKQITKMAKRNKWQLINLYKATSNMPERFPDGIHPDVQGAGIIAEAVKQAVLKEAKKVRK